MEIKLRFFPFIIAFYLTMNGQSSVSIYIFLKSQIVVCFNHLNLQFKKVFIAKTFSRYKMKIVVAQIMNAQANAKFLLIFFFIFKIHAVVNVQIYKGVL